MQITDVPKHIKKIVESSIFFYYVVLLEKIIKIQHCEFNFYFNHCNAHKGLSETF